MIAAKLDFSNWERAFIDFVEKAGLKSSTAKDYAGRIKKILEEEGITIENLAVDIDKWIEEYESGAYAKINKRKHNAPSSALKWFEKLIPTLKTYPILNEEKYSDFTKKNTDIIY